MKDRFNLPRTSLSSKQAQPTDIRTGHATVRNPDAKKNIVSASMQGCLAPRHAIVLIVAIERAVKDIPNKYQMTLTHIANQMTVD